MGEPWRNGLCGHCCGGSCGLCCAAWCCYPNVFSLITERMEKFPEANRKNLRTCTGQGWALCGLTLCHLGWVLVYLRRGEVRKRFGIQGNPCDDCAASYCCMPCVLAQMDTELKDRAKLVEQYDNGGAAAAGEKMIYAPPQQFPGGVPPQGYQPQQQQQWQQHHQQQGYAAPPPGYPPQQQQGYAPAQQGMYYGPQ